MNNILVKYGIYHLAEVHERAKKCHPKNSSTLLEFQHVLCTPKTELNEAKILIKWKKSYVKVVQHTNITIS